MAQGESHCHSEHKSGQKDLVITSTFIVFVANSFAGGSVMKIYQINWKLLFKKKTISLSFRDR